MTIMSLVHHVMYNVLQHMQLISHLCTVSQFYNNSKCLYSRTGLTVYLCVGICVCIFCRLFYYQLSYFLKQSEVKAEEKRLPASTRIRLKIFQILLRSTVSVNLFPSSLQVKCFLFLQNLSLREKLPPFVLL